MICSVNGIEMYYEKCGEGSPVVLIHANSQTHEVFDVVCEDLKKNHTVYMPDSRGHGKSSDSKKLSYYDMAKDFKEFTDNVVGEKATVYGISDGGIIGILLAIYYPESVKNVIVSGANSKPCGLKTMTYLSFRFAGIFSKNPKLHLMLDEPHITKEQLNSVTVPVHVLAGEFDIIKESDTRFIAENIPGATLEILKGETHTGYVTHSKKLYGIIGKYLDSEV